ncbi:hypothetical protein ACLKMY_33850 [Paraburkholderia mimosarum]|uniref:hypothetical protein n=1 Tax=Paraburkholderia mimosarum TaxID=312026 RepID=UPI0012B55DD1|nr:hypothetical protein [Paraburkholderia mimosarum]
MKFTRHKGEPTQPGNPHKLTRDQHVFPKASIQRFYNRHSKVTVVLTRENRRISNVDAGSNLFCADRAWDQRAEAGYMARIEREFQFLATRVLAGDLHWWGLEHKSITLFYALWEQRAHYAANPAPSIKLAGILPGNDLSKNEKEILESKHYLYTEDNGIPSRQFTGMHIQRHTDYRSAQLREVEWSICRTEATAGEFLVPDRPTALCIPLSPTVALLGNADIDRASAETVRLFNVLAAAGSHQFIFARDFSLCFPNTR